MSVHQQPIEKETDTMIKLMKACGIEYHATWNDKAHWSMKTEGPDTWVWLGKLEVIVSRVGGEAAVC